MRVARRRGVLLEEAILNALDGLDGSSRIVDYRFVNGLESKIGDNRLFILPEKFREKTLREYKKWLLERPEIKKLLEISQEKGARTYGERFFEDFFEEIEMNTKEVGKIVDLYQWRVCSIYGLKNCPSREEIAPVFEKENKVLSRTIKDFDFYLRSVNTKREFTKVKTDIPGVAGRSGKFLRAFLANIGAVSLDIIENYQLLEEVANNFDFEIVLPNISINLLPYRELYLKYFDSDEDLFRIPEGLEFKS